MSGQQKSGRFKTEILKSRDLRPGADHYRAFVGPPGQYDFMRATQFRLLTSLGLREEHHVVDIGCGSLRAGRLLLQYLMPGRYTGIEPNSWLWQHALAEEIGPDVIGLKRPRFFEEHDFRMSQIEAETFDFAVAQSIYSHTGADLFTTSVVAVARCLARGGQFLFTAVLPQNPGAKKLADARAKTGWFYPECVQFRPQALRRICTRAGLHVQRLNWYHPRQTWFRAVRDPALLLTPQMKATLGSGAPLFDGRFPDA